MINYTPFFDYLKSTPLAGMVASLREQTEKAFDPNRWGDIRRWQDAYARLPRVKPSIVDFDCSAIRVGQASDIESEDKGILSDVLTDFCPWRKGPFDLFGIYIDSEWRSDIKWDRIKNSISSLKDRTVLDVGCGNGYHCYRMLPSEPKCVLGIDPTMIYVAQFGVLHHYIESSKMAVLPLGIDEAAVGIKGFDTVLSMGLIYHRRKPHEHLNQLFQLLREGGELVLESIVIDGKQGEVLEPKDRYAQMKNVWHIPSVLTLESWLKDAGFVDIRLVDVSKTTQNEQRSTLFSGNKSLIDFLDPDNHEQTIEGYPAPKRAVFIANTV